MTFNALCLQRIERVDQILPMRGKYPAYQILMLRSITAIGLFIVSIIEIAGNGGISKIHAPTKGKLPWLKITTRSVGSKYRQLT